MDAFFCKIYDLYVKFIFIKKDIINMSINFRNLIEECISECIDELKLLF